MKNKDIESCENFNIIRIEQINFIFSKNINFLLILSQNNCEMD